MIPVQMAQYITVVASISFQLQRAILLFRGLKRRSVGICNVTTVGVAVGKIILCFLCVCLSVSIFQNSTSGVEDRNILTTITALDTRSLDLYLLV